MRSQKETPDSQDVEELGPPRESRVLCTFFAELGFPWWLSGEESVCHCRRHGFDPWVGKIP